MTKQAQWNTQKWQEVTFFRQVWTYIASTWKFQCSHIWQKKHLAQSTVYNTFLTLRQTRFWASIVSTYNPICQTLWLSTDITYIKITNAGSNISLRHFVEWHLVGALLHQMTICWTTLHQWWLFTEGQIVKCVCVRGGYIHVHVSLHACTCVWGCSIWRHSLSDP